jgi:methylthioribose-1-phosphate isomerase
MSGTMRTLEWQADTCELKMIDQRLLPGRLEVVLFRDAAGVADAIRNMTVRGAPAIGAAAGFGMALAASRSKARSVDELQQELREAGKSLNASRPTAINLAWAVSRMLRVVDVPAISIEGLKQRVIDEAQKIADEDVATNKRIAFVGETLINDGDTIIHHCNTGALATVDWGTALGIIRLAHERGKRLHVLVDETRPRLQGARLTAWELQQMGISYEIITDNSAGYFLRSGKAQKVFFGADRVAANGDVANKVGSYMLALAAHANNVPVYSIFPITTVDLSLANGDLIPIEERDADEVLDIQIHGEAVTPVGARARNPAFDITPHHLISALVTEKGIVHPPFGINLPKTMRGS